MGLVIVCHAGRVIRNRHRYILYISIIVFLRLISITFSLNLPLWRSKLRDYDDYGVCDFLEFGWPVGLNYISSLSTDQFSRNHKGATDFPQWIPISHSNVLLLSAHFLAILFSRPIVISPLNSVPKPVFRAADDLGSQLANREVDQRCYPRPGLFITTVFPCLSDD